MKTIVVAGTCSGVGKSTIAAGLMAAYSRRGLRVQPFKIGPEFQDPIHHTVATGRQSHNLDMWMLSREVNLTCFGRCISNTDVAIVEGIMGLYDGYDGKSEQGSTAEMAKLLSASVLLVFDCWAFGRSAAAMLQGYTTFDPDVKFAGVILNKVSGPSHTSCLRQAFSLADTKIQVFGGIPKIGELQGFEQNGLRNWDKSVAYMQELADLVELYVDLDAVLEEAASCDLESNFEAFSSETLYHISSPSSSFSKHVRIGIAQDAAFCFHYHENIFLLQDAGAELVYFSPLEDPLPSSLDAIFFGGGHIDPYLEQLSANKQLLYAVKAFADAGGLVYGESCGLMYLSQGVEGLDMQLFSLSGVFPFWTRFGGTSRSSYVKVKPRDNCVFIPAEIGEIKGFLCSSIEIFYQDGNSVDSCCKGFVLKDESTADTEWEGYMHINTICTLVHLHFGSNPRLVHALVDRCRVDRTRAAAVAAASASAVAKAGPEAAAAAGAAAAKAVTAALGEPRELIPYYGLDMANRREDPSYHLSQYMSIPRLALPFRQQSSDDNSLSETGSCSQTCRFSQLDSQEEAVLRRTESFDLHQLRSTSVEVHDCKLPRSESEIWDSQKGRYISNYSLKDISNNAACGSVKTDHSHRCGKSNSVDFGDENCLVPMHGRHTSEDYTERARTQFPTNSKVSKWHCNGNAFMNHVPGHFSLSFRFSGSSQHQDYAKKIVSLLPSVTEILIELGAGSRLVAVTDCCERPSGVQDGRHIVSRSRMDLSPGSNRNLETAGDWKPYLGSLGRKGSKLKLDMPWLSRVKPDLVVTEDSNEDGLDNRTLISAFTQAGLHPGKNTKLQFFNPCNVSEVFDSILELGDAVGLYSEASLLVSQFRARLRKVAASVAHQGRPRVLLLQGLNPLFLGGHWMPELEELAGGYDSLQKPGSTVEMLHWQRIISYAPEVLVLAPCTSNIEQTLLQVELLARLHGFWSIPAVESGRVYICEHACFSSPGPRMVNGVELLASILHPFVTLGIQVQETAWKLHLNYGQRCSPQDLPKHFKPCL